MSTPAQPSEQPLLTLVISEHPGEEHPRVSLVTELSKRQAREYLGQALLEIDQRIWVETREGILKGLPASAF